MIRIGPAGYPSGSRGPEDAIDAVASMGLSALEMQFGRGVRMDLERATAIGRHAFSAGVRLSAHAPYYVNFHSQSQETRDRSIGWVMDTVRVCHRLNASPAVIHAASYGKDKEGSTASVIDGLGRCLEIMDREGIRNVRLGLEAMGKKSSWGTLDELEDAVQALSQAIPVLDLAHLHARDGGFLDSEHKVREILRRGRRMSDGPLHLHVSGIEFGERGERKHLPLDSGSPDTGLLLAPLRELTEDVTVIVESPLPERDAVWLLSRLRQ
ncbi:MAG: TIM barrel protein [Candidatus Methanomethylophilaceae archaeon]